MAEIYKVSNVEEAVELAHKFKKEGKYNWFRGQVIEYIPHSSLYRRLKVKEDAENAQFRYELFCDWLEDIDELKYLLLNENIHELEAIMQHYGIPTHYIDFTTDPGVAGFFASDTKKRPVDKNSCIYCLDIDDLIGIIKDIKSVDKPSLSNAEKIIIDAKNLWRLQAQKGVFLLCNYNLEVHYDLDKIVFPYSGYPSYPTRDDIYPVHKSSLELLLDQYFSKEKAYLFRKDFEKRGGKVYDFSTPLQSIHLKFFREDFNVKHLDSWLHSESNWNSYKNENYHSTSGLNKVILCGASSSPESIRKQISYAIKQISRSDENVRNRVIDWSIKGLDKEIDSLKVTDLVKVVWNGMRLLPFDDEEVSDACGNAVFIYLDYLIDEAHSEKKSFSKLFGESMDIGFTNTDGSGSRGYASISSLTNAIEVGILNGVKDEFVNDVKDIKNLFQMVYNPKLMFDFGNFKNIFATQVIPSQVVFDRQLVLFNPAKIIIFGIP